MMRIVDLIAPCLAASVIVSCSTDAPPGPARAVGTIELTSDYAPLVDGFQWAKGQAMAYAFEGDPVGLWYEAALPGREAFCMRDASHQATGALALGLHEHTKNMMHKFATGIAASRDWCSYWEINRYDEPAPVDYRSDEDFWYNLPANFDVIQANYRIYEWTGDVDFLNDPDFDEFYRRSLTDYVAAWDIDGDGLMESPEENGIRGLATYWEGGGPRATTGADLLAAQFAANLAYSRILALRGAQEDGEPFAREAERLKRLYNDEWWNDDLGRFHTSILEGGSFDTTFVRAMQIFPLYFGIVERHRADRLLENLKVGVNIEENSYLAEVFYAHGRDEAAFGHLMTQMDPELERREYPENPFTAVGGVVRFLVGVNPVASEGVVETRSRLPEHVSWIRLDQVPVLRNRIAVHHIGQSETRFTNESGSVVRWRAVFAGAHEALTVDGRVTEARVRETTYGGAESFIELEVDPGSTSVVSVE
jgi:hypothetical protein